MKPGNLGIYLSDKLTLTVYLAIPYPEIYIHACYQRAAKRTLCYQSSVAALSYATNWREACYVLYLVSTVGYYRPK